MMEGSKLGKKRGSSSSSNSSSKATSLFGTIIKNADYLLDMELSHDLTKKRVRLDVRNTKGDETYLSFLDHLEDCFQSMCRQENQDDEDDDDEEEEDEDDPLYALFFENLKPYGKAYMLDAVVEHGLTSPIIYELDTHPPDSAKKSTTRTYNRKKGRFSAKSAKKNNGFTKHVEDEIMRETSTTPHSHGYDMRKRKGQGPHTETPLMPGVKNSMNLRSVKTEPLNDVDTTSIPHQSNRELRSAKKSPGVNHSQVLKKKTPTSHQDDDNNNIQKKGELQAKVDETYQSFFAGLKLVGDSIIYEYGDHQQILYDEGSQPMSTRNPPMPNPSSQPSSVSTPSSSTRPSTTPIPPSPDLLNASSVTVNAPGKFEKDKRKNKYDELCGKLKQILAKPFNKNEYDELWREMNHRSEVQIYRDSRSGGSYRPGQMGGSYLQKYPDLSNEIEKVKSDSYEVLKRLRMLSFYLQNIPHGFPQPWSAKCRDMFFP